MDKHVVRTTGVERKLGPAGRAREPVRGNRRLVALRPRLAILAGAANDVRDSVRRARRRRGACGGRVAEDAQRRRGEAAPRPNPRAPAQRDPA